MTRSGHLVLAANARLVEQGGVLYLMAPGGVVHRLENESADLMRALLFFLTTPRTRDEVFRYLEALSGGAIEHPQAVDDALALLTSSGAIAEPRIPVGAKGRVVLCISGAIAAAHAPDLVARLQRAGFELRVALTQNAPRFVSAFALEALTQHEVCSDLFRREVPHITLAEWAQLVLVCPATATTISRIAAGDCSDLVSAIAVSSRAPKLLVPSMNAAMLESPQVQRNLHHLRDDGCWITLGGPGEEVATGERASGGMPSHDAVVDLVRLVLSGGKI